MAAETLFLGVHSSAVKTRCRLQISTWKQKTKFLKKMYIEAKYKNNLVIPRDGRNALQTPGGWGGSGPPCHTAGDGAAVWGPVSWVTCSGFQGTRPQRWWRGQTTVRCIGQGSCLQATARRLFTVGTPCSVSSWSPTAASPTPLTQRPREIPVTVTNLPLETRKTCPLTSDIPGHLKNHSEPSAVF